MRFEITKLLMLKQSVETFGKGRVQVGIFGNKNARNEEKATSSLTNAEIGARHEFGFTIPDGPFQGSHVPARSFLRLPIQTHRKEVFQLIQKDLFNLLYEGKIELLLKRMGKACEKIIDQAFQTSGWGSWKPNSPITIILKSRHGKESSMPLIDYGILRRSIASRVNKDVS
jgi:hypothetical protein